MPNVIEAYRDYQPPVRVVNAVTRMTASVPDHLLVGLRTIVLTSSAALSGQRKRARSRARGRKVRHAEARGLYHASRSGEEAWVEVFVDRTLEGFPAWALRVPVILDTPIAEVLFHEIGHHIHETTRPEHRDKEAVAEDWRRRLSREYFRVRYRYLALGLWPLIRIARIVRRLRPHRRRFVQ